MNAQNLQEILRPAINPDTTNSAEMQQIAADIPADFLPGHWDDHPEYPVDQWQREIATRQTRMGYREWVWGYIQEAVRGAAICESDPGAHYRHVLEIRTKPILVDVYSLEEDGSDITPDGLLWLLKHRGIAFDEQAIEWDFEMTYPPGKAVTD